MIGVSQLIDRKVGPNPGKDEVNAMLRSRPWFFFVWSCLRDAQALNAALLKPDMGPEERAFNAGRLDATERILTALPKTIAANVGNPPTQEELETEAQLRETLKGLFNA